MDNFALVASKFSVVVAAPASYEILSRRRSAHSSLPSLPARRGRGKFKAQVFASASSSSNSDMTISGAMAPLPVPSSPTSIGSPLFWIGVGVGLSVVFQVRFALQQAFKTMMGQAAPQGGQFNNPSFGPGSPFPFPATTSSSPTASTTSPARVSTQQSVTLDVPATKVESTSQSEVGDETQLEDENPKKFAFVDVSPEELIPPNGTVKQDGSASNEQTQSRDSPSLLSVDALEKMMEDPTVQKMVYPDDAKSSISPANARYAIGLTPEEVISKIMANPDVAMAFQNPKVKAAIFDCSQNPLSIAKYQNDKEPNLFLLLPLVSVLAMAPDLATGDNAAHLHFYMHDTLSGSTPSAVRVVRVSNATVLGFGDVVVTDDPLTEGPDLRSAPVGRSQGLYSMVSQGTGDAALLLGLNLVFTEGSRNGSTLAVLGWDAVYLPVRELPVVGGSGVFRLARGYALIKTYSLNTTTGDAILEWD
ncbi:Proteasome complex subunit Rpn13 ubiquitin receptor, partial [Musa troglodytarum]